MTSSGKGDPTSPVNPVMRVKTPAVRNALVSHGISTAKNGLVEETRPVKSDSASHGLTVKNGLVGKIPIAKSVLLGRSMVTGRSALVNRAISSGKALAVGAACVVAAAAVARDHVVEGQIVRIAAELAGKPVAQEQVEAGGDCHSRTD